jgi:hypothetical protein
VSNRMQQNFGDGLMTAPRFPRRVSRNRGAPERRLPIGRMSAVAGVVLVLLLPFCGFWYRDSRALLESDLEKEVITAGSVITANPDWAINTWSARKTFSFDTRLSQSEYRSWVKRNLGADWHCRAETAAQLVFGRLLSAEQQVLEIGLDDGGSQGIRVHVTFTAIPT